MRAASCGEQTTPSAPAALREAGEPGDLSAALPSTPTAAEARVIGAREHGDRENRRRG